MTDFRDFIQLNDDGDLAVFDGSIWHGKCCICECTPKILVKYILHPKTTWDLTPYQTLGFAKPAPYERVWLIKECSRGVTYQSGEINHEGTLVGLPSSFDAKYSYDGYMTIQQLCIDPVTGVLILPKCETW